MMKNLGVPEIPRSRGVITCITIGFLTRHTSENENLDQDNLSSGIIAPRIITSTIFRRGSLSAG